MVIGGSEFIVCFTLELPLFLVDFDVVFSRYMGALGVLERELQAWTKW